MKKKVVLLSAGALTFVATLVSGIAVSNKSVSLTELKSFARVNCVNAQDKCYDDFQGITYFQMHDSNSE